MSKESRTANNDCPKILPELPGQFGPRFREPRFFPDGFYRECKILRSADKDYARPAPLLAVQLESLANHAS
jgi:hypothetical protein